MCVGGGASVCKSDSLGVNKYNGCLEGLSLENAHACMCVYV